MDFLENFLIETKIEGLWFFNYYIEGIKFVFQLFYKIVKYTWIGIQYTFSKKDIVFVN